jgi:hypothetical protein
VTPAAVVARAGVGDRIAGGQKVSVVKVREPTIVPSSTLNTYAPPGRLAKPADIARIQALLAR